MAKRPTKKPDPTPRSIGEILRTRRVEVLGLSGRDMARRLDVAPIHISDIETGKRTPSEDLLVRLAREYGVPEAELRAGFSKPDSVVAEIASESSVAAEKVPEFLRTARGLSAGEWDRLIQQAKKLNQGRSS